MLFTVMAVKIGAAVMALSNNRATGVNMATSRTLFDVHGIAGSVPDWL